MSVTLPLATVLELLPINQAGAVQTLTVEAVVDHIDCRGHRSALLPPVVRLCLHHSLQTLTSQAELKIDAFHHSEREATGRVD